MYVFILLYQAIFSRLSGNGFGKKWNVPWLPELLFSIPFGIALGYALYPLLGIWAGLVGGLATGWTFGFMQSGTWLFLRWEHHNDPNLQRDATLKPLTDWIADKFGYYLGDEGYAWVAASLKGFLIGLPVGGIPLAILWPLGYEIGSHAKGRVEKYGIDPHAVSEVMAGIGAGIAIVLFLLVI